MDRIEEVAVDLLGPNWAKCPAWPADVFAVVGTILSRSGAYLRSIEIHPTPILAAGWAAECERVGKRWRGVIDASSLDDWLVTSPRPRPPKEVTREWSRLVASKHAPIGDLQDGTGTPSLIAALLKLTGFADCASAGMGLDTREDDWPTFRFVEEFARLKSDHRSSCLVVSNSSARVLPKQHTPQRGATLRSITHHLALMPHLEVDARWFRPNPHLAAAKDNRLNLLCLPWPLKVQHADFESIDPTDVPTMDPTHHRFFTLRRRADRATVQEFREYVVEALHQAAQFCDRVDVLVFPELSLDLRLYRELLRIIRRHQCIAIAGVAIEEGERLREVSGPANASVFATPEQEGNEFVQRKHHRWCLEGTQIVQYGLAGRLPASVDLWEHIALGRRDALFHTISPWLTFTTLICEDLARQDPMAATIRAVGPNIVFALLMDGPQLKHRWGPRYAAALAEDPGSSVLILTSLGMAGLSVPKEKEQKNRNRVVGLWKDVRRDVELELAPEETALLLHLEKEARTEFTLDGRDDGQNSFFPVLRDFRGLSVAPGRRAPLPSKGA